MVQHFGQKWYSICGHRLIWLMDNVNVPFVYIIPIILFWEKALEKVDNKPYTGVFSLCISEKRGII